MIPPNLAQHMLTFLKLVKTVLLVFPTFCPARVESTVCWLVVTAGYIWFLPAAQFTCVYDGGQKSTVAFSVAHLGHMTGVFHG